MAEMLPPNWDLMSPNQRIAWREKQRNLAQKVQPEFIGVDPGGSPPWADTGLAYEQMKKQLYGSIGIPSGPLAGGSGPINVNNPQKGYFGMRKLDTSFAHELLAGRMRMAQGSQWPFEHLSLNVGAQKVTLFIIAKGGPVILEDDEHMFPSDKLVAELQLLQG